MSTSPSRAARYLIGLGERRPQGITHCDGRPGVDGFLLAIEALVRATTAPELLAGGVPIPGVVKQLDDAKPRLEDMAPFGPSRCG